MPANNIASKHITCKITTGGTLGTMAVAWTQIAGAPANISSTGSSWDASPPYATDNICTFPAGTYVLNDVYQWMPGDANATRVVGSGAPVPTCRSKQSVPVLGPDYPGSF
jgi:hypothetical protein